MNYFLCNFAEQSAISLGPVPAVWGNASGLSDLSSDVLANLACVGYPNFGFLVFEDAVAAGISPASLVAMRDLFCDVQSKVITEERERRTLEGGVAVLVDGISYKFHTDLKSRSQFSLLDSMATRTSLPDSAILDSAWKTMTGVKVPMTVALLRQIIDAGIVQESAIYHASEAHIAAMRNSSHPETYNYLTGWPS